MDIFICGRKWSSQGPCHSHYHDDFRECTFLEEWLSPFHGVSSAVTNWTIRRLVGGGGFQNVLGPTPRSVAGRLFRPLIWSSAPPQPGSIGRVEANAGGAGTSGPNGRWDERTDGGDGLGGPRGHVGEDPRERDVLAAWEAEKGWVIVDLVNPHFLEQLRNLEDVSFEPGTTLYHVVLKLQSSRSQALGGL